MKVKSCHTCTHKLVKCDVVNKKLEKSCRYIKLEKYKMWSYIMEQKHGLSIVKKSLCLWMNTAEYEANSRLFGPGHKKEEVSMIEMMIFDEHNSSTFSITRFVPSETTDKVKEILKGHVNEKVIASDCLEVVVYPGYILSQARDIDKFVCGLSNIETAALVGIDIS